ncbi:hypothetical protein BG011_006046 [Mortierella polycephala]|uniref:Extracellular membrane protein CFEM domain-containing protein n=1 Tax=Mortierella polycephala TaxID=41804 RepID=A0A9P6PTU4_9FUNG|nr:hypothetical protein BG011_006046 [Mortierella polycephala]
MKIYAFLSLSAALVAASEIADYISSISSDKDNHQASCLAALRNALCLLEFPKCKGQTQETLPVCWSVRDYVLRACDGSATYQKSSSEPEPRRSGQDRETIAFAHIQNRLFSSTYDARWASSPSIQEPNCVSFEDHGLGTAPVDNIVVVNDLDKNEDRERDPTEEGQWIKDQSVAELNADQDGLFECLTDEDVDPEDDIQPKAVEAMLKARHLSRRERTKHHHHHHRNEKRKDEEGVAAKFMPVEPTDATAEPLESRADGAQDQTVYSVYKEDNNSESESDRESATMFDKSQQRVLAQSGSNSGDPAAAAEALEKSGSGHLEEKNATEISAGENEVGHSNKGTVILAAVPILLLMAAIAGFTAYRRYYENSFNKGGRNDTHDDLPGDGYHQRDVPIRSGSPILFDRTFINTIHSPPPTATYLHDPENASRHHSPSSIVSVANMKRPPPSAGSHGKTRFQELSRSYDFGAGFRSIKNALIRSSNNSRESALDQASGFSNAGSNSSLNGKNINYAFGAGGHPIARIGSHPGLSATERRQLQQYYGAGAGPSGSESRSGSTSGLLDINTMILAQEHSIIWGQYSANEDDASQDAASTLASNLARKSVSSASLSLLSGGKYSHHHQQSSGHLPDTLTDCIGDCLAPESPALTREQMMRRRDLYAEGYTFDFTESVGDDAHSGTDLLFEVRDHFFDLGSEKVHGTALRDEEMDMYLNMEKEESPYAVDDYNMMNPAPYEPKVLNRHIVECTTTAAIQKTSVIDEEEMDEKKALQVEDDAYVKAVETQEAEVEVTHILGGDSPEWSNPGNAEQDRNIEHILSKDTFGEVRSALGLLNGRDSQAEIMPIAAEVVDPHGWEEEPRDATTGFGISQENPGHGKKKNKSKSKKGRRH